MKLNELRQIIREEIKEVIVEAKEMRRPMGDLNKLKGKTRRMHTVPRNKAEITYNNVMRRYSDNDIEIGMMSLRKWDMLPDNEIDLEREKIQ